MLTLVRSYIIAACIHLALQKNAPLHRTVQTSGRHHRHSILSRLHQQYVYISQTVMRVVKFSFLRHGSEKCISLGKRWTPRNERILSKTKIADVRRQLTSLIGSVGEIGGAVKNLEKAIAKLKG